MNKYPLIGGSILAVVLIILGSLSNVVGFQTVQSSNQKVISTEVDQKELLFQTILDMANNKEIQKIILKSQINGEGLFNPNGRFLIFTPQVLTKKELNTAYNICLILLRIFGLAGIHSMINHYREINQGVQKEITAVIEKDATLKGEITQLSNSKCECENKSTIRWNFPVLCNILYPIFIVAEMIWYSHIPPPFDAIIGIIVLILLTILLPIGSALNCFWYPY
jgi:hypothetical protein